MTTVHIVESERGWGQKIDDVKEFPTLGEAKAFVLEFNSANDLAYVPDWYMYAEIVE